MKLSPAVARRVKLSLELEEALATNAEEIAAAHAELVSPVLEPGESVPDVAATLDCYRRVLALAREVMVAADLLYLAGFEDDARLCGVRDSLLAAISKSLSRIRRTCMGWLGRRGLAPLGLAKAVAQGQAVVEQAEKVLRCLLEYQPDPDDGPLTGAPDFKGWLTTLAEDLQPQLMEVASTSEALEEVRDGAKPRTEERRTKIDEFDRHYLSIGRCAEATLRMTGRHEEADRIHPSTRKLDRKGEDD